MIKTCYARPRPLHTLRSLEKRCPSRQPFGSFWIVADNWIATKRTTQRQKRIHGCRFLPVRPDRSEGARTTMSRPPGSPNWRRMLGFTFWRLFCKLLFMFSQKHRPVISSSFCFLIGMWYYALTIRSDSICLLWFDVLYFDVIRYHSIW